jgi:NADH-quinone oxidoreductase subunit M
VAAPTAASMLLAGVVMKLGAYGCLRVAMPLFPDAFIYCQPVIAWLAVVGIVYAGCIALVQDDFKFVIGYSSVSHMGFVLLGLAAATPLAMAGAVLQMFSHGVIAGLLFAVVGRMVYERTHTRRLADLKAMPLHRLLPFAAVIFVVAGLASLGLPGFSGFPAELSILIGTWQENPLWAVVAALGIVVAGAFTLRVIQVSFFGTTSLAAIAAAEDHPLPPITRAEKAGALLLIAATLYVGLKPDVLLDWIVPALQSPAFQAVMKGGNP